MAMFNDLFELLADVPPMLAAAWFAWLSAGALLVMWFRRAKLEAGFPAPAPKPVLTRPKPVTRSSSDADMQTAETLATDVSPHADERMAGAPAAASPAAVRSKSPMVVGDPFGDLATLLDQPAGAVATPAPVPAEPRAPADSPILSSSGSPIRPQTRHRLQTDLGV